MTSLVMNTVSGFETLLRSFLTGWAISTGKIMKAYTEKRTIHAMQSLSDYTLRDIGLSREQVLRGDFTNYNIGK